jgi:hypothetical protein
MTKLVVEHPDRLCYQLLVNGEFVGEFVLEDHEDMLPGSAGCHLAFNSSARWRRTQSTNAGAEEFSVVSVEDMAVARKAVEAELAQRGKAVPDEKIMRDIVGAYLFKHPELVQRRTLAWELEVSDDHR